MFQCSTLQTSVTSVCPYYWVEKLTAPFTENVVSLYLFHVSMFNTADFLLQVSCPYYWVEKLTAPFTENVVSLYLFHVSMFNTADFLLQVSTPTTGRELTAPLYRECCLSVFVPCFMFNTADFLLQVSAPTTGRETDCSLYRECCLSVFVPCFNVQHCRLPVTSVCPFYWVEKLTAPFTENVVSLYLFHVSMFNTADFLLQVSAPSTG